MPVAQLAAAAAQFLAILVVDAAAWPRINRKKGGCFFGVPGVAEQEVIPCHLQAENGNMRRSVTHSESVSVTLKKAKKTKQALQTIPKHFH